MKKEHLLKSLLVVLAMSLFSMVAFAQTPAGVYKKVTATPTDGDLSGTYLIVGNSGGSDHTSYVIYKPSYQSATNKIPTSYFPENFIFSGDAITITEEASLRLKQIVYDLDYEDWGGAYVSAEAFHVVIDKDGGILAPTGHYLGAGSSSSKSVYYSKTLMVNTFTFNADGSVNIVSKNGSRTKTFRVTSSGCYYHTSTLSGQMPVFLYKLSEDGEGGGGDVVVAPEKPTASVESGDYLEAFSVTLACATDGATIKYKLNGGEEQTYSEAINISATTTLVAWAEKDTLKSEEVTFTYTLPAEVANIAAFIADESGKNVRIASTMTVIIRSSAYLYVKDESGYMLVNGKVNTNASTYNTGDQFTGLVGTAKVVNGIKELTPANFPTTTATGVAVEPEVVAMKDITTAFAHKYIVLEDEATFVSRANEIAPIVVTIADKEYTMPDRFTKFVNNWKPVAGDMFKVTAIVGFDANGNVELYPTAMEKIEKPEVKATWNIEEGATVESLGNISVTFDGVEKAATTQTVPVCFYAVDENNVETPVTGLATAGAISASFTNATITFDASSYGNLAEGKYCIRLAVGDVYFNGDKANVSTEEYVLTFNYVLPVEPTFTVSPENHSIVREFKEIVITYPELEMIGVKSFVGEPGITWPFFNQTLVNENGEVIAEQAMVPMVWEQVAANAVKISLSTNYGFASVATAGTYSVTIPAGLIIFPTNQSNRAFTLYYTVDSNPTDVDNATLSTIFVQDGRIVAEGEYQIYTITGQNVTGMNGSLENGVYVVKSANAAVKVVVK